MGDRRRRVRGDGDLRRVTGLEGVWVDRLAEQDDAGELVRRVDIGLELESACLDAAVEASKRLPSGGWLSLNVSPDLLLERRRLRSCLRPANRPTVLEVTEHVAIEDYRAFREAVSSIDSEL